MSTPSTPAQYVEQLPADRKPVIRKLRAILRKNLPKGFKEELSYNMLGYVVPHKLYPEGYHCSPELPLPFINLASQKGGISLYHMGIYSDDKLMKWFQKEYKNRVKTKLDMGKSCIRFKKMDDIPYELIGQLAGKMTPEDWIALYERQIRR
ncbi:MAG: DUF1801 domain-containing protein [Granulosicoccus sp.]|nr:DUF1801 domain-containing protein [Granulosicoccus sp.]